MKAKAKVVPAYTKTAKKIALAVWNASKTKKVRARRTRNVELAFKEFESKMKEHALHMFMVLKCGYGVRSPEFKTAKKQFNELVKMVERGCATGNAWLEIADANK